MSIERYSVITHKNPREILLLKGRDCQWGFCSFCDYIHDNSNDDVSNINVNRKELEKITGQYQQLEIINSGSCFDLPNHTLKDIQNKVREKGIQRLYFESHYMYRERLGEFKRLFDVPIIFKCGIETFDDYFRNKVLRKGVNFSSPQEVANYFESVCLLVGIQGQTKSMIRNDIEIAKKYFKYCCINIFCENSTDVKADYEIINWFKNEFAYLNDLQNFEVLWHNTDFGVGGEKNE